MFCCFQCVLNIFTSATCWVAFGLYPLNRPTHFSPSLQDFTDSLSKGQTSLQAVSSLLSFPLEVVYDSVKYQFVATSLGPNYYSLKINGEC